MAGQSIEQVAKFFERFNRFGGTDFMLKKLLGSDMLMELWVEVLVANLNTNPTIEPKGGGGHMTSPKIGQTSEFFRRFHRFGGTDQILTKLLNDDDLMQWWILFFYHGNFFTQTVEEQIDALRKQNDLGGWGISQEDIDNLALNAPAWPEGRDAFRSLRIRFGTGREGMIETFEAHAGAIRREQKPKYDREWRLQSGMSQYEGNTYDTLRLFAGNESHSPTLEWIIIPDLSAYNDQGSVFISRTNESLADEGLVFIWLNPKRIRAIDNQLHIPFFLAGYEVNMPALKREDWYHAVAINRTLLDNVVTLTYYQHSDNRTDYAVPRFLK